MLDAVLVRDDLPELGTFIRGVNEDKIAQRRNMKWAYRSGFRTVDGGERREFDLVHEAWKKFIIRAGLTWPV